MTQAAPPPGERVRRRTTGKWQHVFLAALARTSNVAAAADEAEIDTGNAYKLRRTDPVFARRWYEALCEGYDNLEMDLLYRMRAGEPVNGLAASGGEAEERRKFDNSVALRLLAAHRATVGRERGRNDYAYEEDILASINAKLERMRQRIAAKPALPELPEPDAATDGD